MPLTALFICKERPAQQSAVTAPKALHQLSGFKSPTLGSDRLLGLFPQQNSYLLQTGRGAGQIAKQKDSNAASEAASADPGQCLLGSAASAQAHKRSSSLPARAVHDAHGEHNTPAGSSCFPPSSLLGNALHHYPSCLHTCN